MENVAITGMGVISSIGSNFDEVNRNFHAGHVAVQAAPWAGDEGLDYAWVSLINDFEPEQWMDQRVITGSDPFTWYAVAAAVQAVEDSGLTDLDPRRTAVIMGSANPLPTPNMAWIRKAPTVFRGSCNCKPGIIWAPRISPCGGTCTGRC